MTFHEDDGQDDGDGESYVGATNMVQYNPNTALGLRSPLPPWHLWGSSQLIEIASSPGGVQVQLHDNQLCRISYRRPETWHWVFMTRIVQAPTPSGPAGNASVLRVQFDLTVGIGRSSTTMPAFEVHQMTAINPGGFLPAFTMRTTSVVGRRAISFDGLAITETTTEISEIVAQDAQLNTRVSFQGDAGQTAMIEISAYFSPKNHIRPDWFADGPGETVFAGAENGGR